MKLGITNKRNFLIYFIIILVISIILIGALVSYFLNNNNSFTQLTVDFFTIFQKLVLILIIFFIFKLGLFLLKIIFKKISKNSERSKDALLQLISFFWWAVFIIITLSTLVENIGALVTSLGLIGLGLSLALQKPVLNFVGWITIIINDIYSEGDRVKIGDFRGDVKEIQMMNTVLYSLLETSDIQDHKIMTIPNELILSTKVENYTKDSNYILDELAISITYESNYNKAIDILREIVTSHLQKNIKAYIRRELKKQKRLEEVIKKINGDKKNSIEKEDLKKQQEDVEKKIESLEDMEEDFKPKIRVMLADSAILLFVQFLTPYDRISKNRTDINLAFLDSIKNEDDIEVAYPHLELVYNKKRQATEVDPDYIAEHLLKNIKHEEKKANKKD